MANREAKFTLTADDKASANVKKVTSEVGNLKTALGTIASAAAPALAAFASFEALKGFADMIQHSNELTESLRETSQRIGINVTDLQAYELAASNAGISSESLEKSIEKLNKSAGDIKNGFTDMGGSAGKAFTALGISLEDIQKSTPDELFEKVIDQLGKVQDPAQRASDAMAIFGKSGANVLTLVADGAEGIEKAKDLLNEFGVSITQIDTDKVHAANESLNELGAIATAAGQKLGADLAPAITAVAKIILDEGADGNFDIGKYIHDGVQTGVTALDRLISFFQTVYQGIKAGGDTVVAVFLSIGAAVAGAGATILEVLGGSGVTAFNNFAKSAEDTGNNVASAINTVMNVVVTSVNSTINTAIDAFEKLINGAISGINTLISAANSVVPGGTGISAISAVSLGRADFQAPQLPTATGYLPQLEPFGQDTAASLRGTQSDLSGGANVLFNDANDAAGKAGDAFGNMVNGTGDFRKAFDDASNSVTNFTKQVDPPNGNGGATDALDNLGKGLGSVGKLAKSSFDIIDAEAKSVTSNMEKSIDDFVKTGQFSFSTFATSVLQDLAAIQLKAAIIGGIFGSSKWGGSGGGLLGSLVYGAGGADAYAGIYNIPKAIPVSYDGGGFTGSGARSGGVDGKGGFAAILHPNETVLDHTKGQTGGAVTVQQTVVVRETLASGIAAQIANAATNAAMANLQSINARGGKRRKSFGLH